MNYLTSIAKKKRSRAALCLFISVSFLSAPLFANTSDNNEMTPGGKIAYFGLPKDQAILAKGKKVYDRYCMGCHGIDGDGKGPAAKFLDPKPRNFQLASYRFQSTPSGDLPTDEDLHRTLVEGLKGTSMPSWRFMPDDEREAIIAYIKSFAPGAWDEGHGPVTTLTEDPYLYDKEAGIARGEKVYHGYSQCHSCHAAYISPLKINEARAEWGLPPAQGFRENLGRSKPMENSEGEPVIPPDFKWDQIKRGSDLETLYHSIGNGISGTPMPTWKGILEEEDLWGLVYYVQSLIAQRPTRVTEDDIKQHIWLIDRLNEQRDEYEVEQKKLKEQKLAEEARAKAKAAEEKAAKEKLAAQQAAAAKLEESQSGSGV